jgi:hypothetical protein
MVLTLADHVYSAAVGDQLVLLDTRHSRYFAVPDAARWCFDDEAAKTAERVDPAALVRAGILVDRLEPAKRADRPMPAAATSVWRSSPGAHPSSVSLVLRAVALQVGSYWRIRTRPLAEVLNRLHRLKNQSAIRSSGAGDWYLANRIAQFQRTHALVAAPDRCLLKAIALFRFLIDLDPEIVFMIGVRAAPFAAHAWVQRRNVLLDDAVDRVRLFTPILAI